MYWKLKATMQNAISLLPSDASYEAYYWAQRHFGGLRRSVPTSKLIAAIETWKRIQSQERSPMGKVFLEIGTGRVPLVPIAYWLMGAESTITIDLNPYLKEELISEHLYYLSNHEDEILALFGSLMDKKRFNDLVKLAGHLEKYKFSWDWLRDFSGFRLFRFAIWQLIEVPRRKTKNTGS